MKYGLWDTNPEGNPGWLGDSKGPKLFDDFGLASVGKHVWAKQTGWSPHRITVKKYHPLVNARRVHAGDVKMSAMRAIRELEEGT